MRITLLLLILSFAYSLNAQTLIATSKDPNAIANHNQRKIVRGEGTDKFAVFTDSSENGLVIKGVRFDEEWGEPFILTEGQNPSLGYHYGKYSLVFERTDSLQEIYLTTASNDLVWSEPVCVSDTTLNSRDPQIGSDFFLFYIQENNDGTESLIKSSCSLLNFNSEVFFTRDTIIDYACAEDLSGSYEVDPVISIQFDNDSIYGFNPLYDNLIDSLPYWTAQGTFPGVNFNQVYDYFLYLNQNNQIVINNYEVFSSDYPVDYLCVDDVIPPVGFSFLFKRRDTLFHAFFDEINLEIRDTVPGSPLHPSIAYLKFSKDYIDYLWMEDKDSIYEIYYKRDAKHDDIGAIDPDPEDGIQLTGYPNPFKDNLNIQISSLNWNQTPDVSIYNIKSQKVKTLKPQSRDNGTYNYQWNGTSENGVKLNPGIYFVVCTDGKQKDSRRIVLTE